MTDEPDEIMGPWEALARASKILRDLDEKKEQILPGSNHAAGKIQHALALATYAEAVTLSAESVVTGPDPQGGRDGR